MAITTKKLHKDLNQKDLLSILFFIIPSLKERIKPIKMNMKRSIWGEKYVIEYNNDTKTLYIRRYVTKTILGKDANFNEVIPEAIKINSNWDIEYRSKIYKGESRTSVFYSNEWHTPKIF